MGVTKEQPMRLYLDVCSLNRPYDDPAIDRNRLEAEAVIIMLGRIRQRRHEMISSEIVEREIAACPDLEKAELVRESLRLAAARIEVGDAELDRWEELKHMGFASIDALHIACAEAAECDLLLTTDDKLCKRAQARSRMLRVRVMNPLTFVTEVEP
jgi:predicted nucleic acid-binding protein